MAKKKPPEKRGRKYIGVATTTVRLKIGQYKLLRARAYYENTTISAVLRDILDKVTI